jgi:LAO/AO transport system kinase
MLQLGARGDWSPPVLETVASEDKGIREVWEALRRHRAHLEASGGLAERRRRRVETEVLELVERDVRRRLRARLEVDGTVARLVGAARDGELDPHTAAQRIAEAEFGAGA